MPKSLDKMTKAELIAKVQELADINEIALSQLAQLRADKVRLLRENRQLQTDLNRLIKPIDSEDLGTKARRYCQIHGVTSVDKSTLMNWPG